jgi:hypothetical protein
VAAFTERLRSITDQLEDSAFKSGGKARFLAFLADIFRALDDILNRERVVEFTIPGAVFVTDSQPWEPDTQARLRRAVMKLGNPGTTATTATISINGGAPIATITLASGETRVEFFDFSADTVLSGDDLVVAVTAAGAGAERWILLLYYH